MKTSTLLFCFAFYSLAGTANAQTRKFMDSASSLWVERMLEYDQGGSLGVLKDWRVVYAIESDTFINQLRYGKIIELGSYGETHSGGQSGQMIPYRTVCTQNCYVGAIRLDTNLNQVLFRSSNAVTDKVLYDFDSVVHPQTGAFDEPDSFLFDGQYYSIWGIPLPMSYSVSELTGASSSVLDPGMVPFETEYYVECIYSERLGKTDQACLERRSFLLSAPKAEHLQLAVFPNPAREQITLVLPESGPAAIDLFDATGRKVWNQALHNPETMETLSYSTFSPGIYFIRVSQNGNTYHTKVVRE